MKCTLCVVNHGYEHSRPDVGRRVIVVRLLELPWSEQKKKKCALECVIPVYALEKDLEEFVLVCVGLF